MQPVNLDEFKRLDIRVGKVVDAQDHPNADKLLVLRIDVGGGQVVQTVAGIKAFYPASSMIGRSVIVLCNLQPVTLRGVQSHGMILAASSEGRIVILVPEQQLPPGSKVS
jgi:methionyl-tRNA synthetase